MWIFWRKLFMRKEHTSGNLHTSNEDLRKLKLYTKFLIYLYFCSLYIYSYVSMGICQGEYVHECFWKYFCVGLYKCVWRCYYVNVFRHVSMWDVMNILADVLVWEFTNVLEMFLCWCLYKLLNGIWMNEKVYYIYIYMNKYTYCILMNECGNVLFTCWGINVVQSELYCWTITMWDFCVYTLIC